MNIHATFWIRPLGIGLQEMESSEANPSIAIRQPCCSVPSVTLMGYFAVLPA
jgi:hypothetical protein